MKTWTVSVIICFIIFIIAFVCFKYFIKPNMKTSYNSTLTCSYMSDVPLQTTDIKTPDQMPRDKTVKLMCGTASYLKTQNDKCNKNGQCLCEGSGLCNDSKDSPGISSPLYFTDTTDGLITKNPDESESCKSPIDCSGDPTGWQTQHYPLENNQKCSDPNPPSIYGNCWTNSSENKDAIEKCKQFLILNNLTEQCDMSKQI